MGPRNPSRHRWLVPFRSCCHLMAYRTSRVWYPARVLATHVGLAYHHKKRTKSTQKHRKNRPGLLLRRLLSFHCPFTDQRCLYIWFYNGLFFGKRSRLLLYGVGGLYHPPSSVLITVRDGARHPRGIYLLLSCAAEFRLRGMRGRLLSQLDPDDECLSRPVVNVCCGRLCC